MRDVAQIIPKCLTHPAVDFIQNKSKIIYLIIFKGIVLLKITLREIAALKFEYMSISEVAGLFLEEPSEIRRVIKIVGIRPAKNVLKVKISFNNIMPVSRRVDGLTKNQLIKIYKYLSLKRRYHSA